MSFAVWLWLIIIAVIILGCYWLYKTGGIGKLKISNIGPKPTVEQLVMQTRKESARAEELRKVLEAKRELARARAESIRLMKDIDAVSARSVEKEKQDADKEEQEAKKARPRRL